MFRDMLSGSRAIFIGLVFFVLVVGASLLYSWHVHRTTDAELAETQRKVQPLENKNETLTAANTVDTSRVDFGQAGTDLETDDAQMLNNTGVSPIDETSEGLDLSDAFLPDDFVSEKVPAEEVPVSPYGFGPYPEVPADYPFTPFWLRYQKDPEIYDAKYTIDRLKGKELLSRIMVKAWTQGIRDFTGGSFEATTGKYYLHLPNTIYVEYDEPYENEDGTFTRPFAVVTSGNISLTPEQMQRGIAPPGVRVIEGGSYDPYEYLDLP